MPTRRALTLIELLAVISIIAPLMVVLTPARAAVSGGLNDGPRRVHG